MLKHRKLSFFMVITPIKFIKKLQRNYFWPVNALNTSIIADFQRKIMC